MPLSELDTGGIGRTLASLADRSGDSADAFFEVAEQVRYAPARATPHLTRSLEAGLAVRLLRGSRGWTASSDVIDGDALEQAVLRVARSRPAARPTPPALGPGRVPTLAVEELEAFPDAVAEAIHSRLAAFPVQMEVARHRRWVRVVGPVIASDPQAETFYSVRASTPWGRFGELAADLDSRAATRWADLLTGLFRSRDRPPPTPTSAPVVLGPGAAAVFLHEAVAHALETDTELLGPAEDLPGLQLSHPCLSVGDDPGAAPEACRRSVDDEGSPTLRRWLLRSGVVEQPLADLRSAAESRTLVPGAGRRGSRHQDAVPRSSVLDVVAGGQSGEDLRAASVGGLWLPEATRGRLDPGSGRFELRLPFGRRLGPSGPADWVGPCRLHGDLRSVLSRVRAVGADVEWAGSGWCAKGGVRVPVWARSPSLLVDGVQVSP